MIDKLKELVVYSTLTWLVICIFGFITKFYGDL